MPSRWQLDHVETDAMRPGVGRRLLSGIALVHKGDLDRLSRHVLDVLASAATWVRSCSLANVTRTVNTCPSESTAT